MQEKTRPWMPLRAGETGLALTLGLILFANYAAMGITKVVAVSGFLSQVKDHYILLVWAVDMVLLILATGLQSLIVDRYDRVKLLAAVLLVFTALYALLPLTFLSKKFPPAVSYTLIYLLNDQQWRFFPVVFWILVNDIYDPGTGRRVMPVIANFAFAGTICGLAIAALDSKFQMGPTRLLFLNAGIFLTAFAVARLGLRGVRVVSRTRTQESMRATLTEGWEFIRTVPAYAYLALSMLGAGAVMTILLYAALSDAKLALQGGFQAFYAAYNLAIALGSIFVQSISSWLIERLGLKRAFAIQPLMMLAATVANFVVPGFVVSSSAQGVARVTYDTVDLSARKAFQALVPNEKRGRVSIFIDSYLPSGGTIIGSLFGFIVTALGLRMGLARAQYGAIYLGAAILMALTSLYAAFKLGSSYEQSMLNWQLKRRTRGASVLDKIKFGEDES